MAKLYCVVTASSEEMNKSSKEGYRFIGTVKNKVVMEKDAHDVPTARELVSGKLFIEEFVVNNDQLTDEAKAMLAEMAQTKRGPWSVRSHITSVKQTGGQVRVHMNNGYANYSL